MKRTSSENQAAIKADRSVSLSSNETVAQLDLLPVICLSKL